MLGKGEGKEWDPTLINLGGVLSTAGTNGKERYSKLSHKISQNQILIQHSLEIRIAVLTYVWVGLVG
jgi:hypothetical protein